MKPLAEAEALFFNSQARGKRFVFCGTVYDFYGITDKECMYMKAYNPSKRDCMFFYAHGRGKEKLFYLMAHGRQKEGFSKG